jgi:hypothetical protein
MGGWVKHEAEATHGADEDADEDTSSVRCAGWGVGAARGAGVDAGAACGAGWGVGATRGMAIVSEVPTIEER